jgi:hypothetical protein
MNEIAVCDGLRYIGCVIERDAKRCQAYDASGQALGVFSGPQKAVSAVCESAREQHPEVAA